VPKFLITSAIPYVNGVKHLGNLVGSLLPADVHARFRRQLGDEVLFICGTDEHGTPTELAAADADLPVGEFCLREHLRQASIYRRFGLSFDYFGRSSSLENHALTQHFYRCLDAAGLIEEREVQQVWSPRDRRFLPDRYVLGICPHCRSPDARGDQCDACGRLLDPPELIQPHSAISGDRSLELRWSRHLFLRQSELVTRLQAWLETRHGWPPFVLSLARSWLTSELRDRCITRDLSWGVPVPRSGFDGKVFYVWFDAPIAYIAATQAWAADDPARRRWEDWWYESEDTRYIQFLGKDNVPFHAVSFPATLLGSGEPWKTADIIKGFHWLSYAGGKFSTSRKRGVFTDAALEELPADLWRWWLIANAPETSDTDFTVERFVADVNKDLADVFGNLVNRILVFSSRTSGGRIPAGGQFGPDERVLANEVASRLAAIRHQHEQLDFRRAAAEIRALWVLANTFLQRGAPWSAGADRAAVITRVTLNLVRLCAIAAHSIVPSLGGSVLAAFNDNAASPPWPRQSIVEFLDGDAGRAVKPIGRLVDKLSHTDVLRLKRRFGDGDEPAVSGRG
jgi:methionyl-tRNA synthetase